MSSCHMSQSCCATYLRFNGVKTKGTKLVDGEKVRDQSRTKKNLKYQSRRSGQVNVPILYLTQL